MKYTTIFDEIHEICQQYQQLEFDFFNINHSIPSLIEPMQKLNLKNCSNKKTCWTKDGQDLVTYFCAGNWPLEVCLSTVGQLVDQCRLAHIKYGERNKQTVIKTNQLHCQRSLSLRMSSTSFFYHMLNDNSLSVPIFVIALCLFPRSSIFLTQCSTFLCIYYSSLID